MNLNFSSIIYFYSPSFLIFFILVFAIYWSLRKGRNAFLLLASYTFYCSWDYRFLSLVLISTIVDYYCARQIEDSPQKKKLFMYLSVGSNILILCIFKYANFFLDSAVIFLGTLGLKTEVRTLNIILPLGISFYTFQTMSYVIDVQRGKIKAQRNFLEMALFVSYFPQLIAGPIERASHLIPEILKEKKWSAIPWAEGIYLFIFGLFKKRVMADFLAYAVARGYAPEAKAGIITLTGFLSYTFQVYGDISGYADMARGMSLLLGIRLSPNFYFPYFSPNPVEYWKRWHITLSVWARHYIFTPLITRWKKPALVIFTTFMVMGIWHGPRWHYVHWGIYWAIWSILYQKLIKGYLWKNYPGLEKAMSWQWVMILVIFIGQSFFRADSISSYLNLWLSARDGWWSPEILNTLYIKTFAVIFLFIGYEAWCLKERNEFRILKQNFYVQSFFYFMLIFLYRNIGETAAIDFIYFQF